MWTMVGWEHAYPAWTGQWLLSFIRQSPCRQVGPCCWIITFSKEDTNMEFYVTSSNNEYHPLTFVSYLSHTKYKRHTKAIENTFKAKSSWQFQTPFYMHINIYLSKVLISGFLLWWHLGNEMNQAIMVIITSINHCMSSLVKIKAYSISLWT